ncbi:MAG: adenylosuccinate lyase, partial [Candidatus Thermoplasmatota archaeon]|nr:adenylosuccinate lyase [Candidatus Thermoplasmatota archaeon]
MLIVNDKKMLENLKNDDFILSERFVSELTLTGIPRQDAHEMVRKASMNAHSKGISLVESLTETGILARFPKDKIRLVTDPTGFTGSAGRICDAVLSQTEYRCHL